MTRECLICPKSFQVPILPGSVAKLYCSRRCRIKAKETRRKVNQVMRKVFAP